MVAAASSNTTSVTADKMIWPPGFRFHPTDEELVLYYLKRKICKRPLKLDVIAVLDVYKWDPQDLPGRSLLKNGDRQWFFFSPRDRKYPNAARSNRATLHGYWKATGKDRNISCNSRTVGLKKTLVFYRGRAPNGERTDWVMHEYTMDEEELRRCQNVGAYYALYKVYMKSGPGPKNGEQYGAPFQEEEWGDDDFPEANNHTVETLNAAKNPTGIASLDGVVSNINLSVHLGNFEESVYDFANNPLLNKQTCLPGYNSAFHPVLTYERNVCPIVSSFAEPNVSNQNCRVVGSFGYTESASTHLPLQEVSEVTSVINIDSNLPDFSEEDFLEIADLIGPELNSSGVCQQVENFDIDFDGLSETDLYHDAALFLQSTALNEKSTVSHQYLNFPENELVYHSNDQLPFEFDGTGQRQWGNNQNDLNPSESIPGILSIPNSGVVAEDSNVSPQLNQTNGDIAGSSSPNRFTSALWAFVESIPTTPASASENALVNRAFDRVSSFSRLRVNTGNTNSSTTGNTSVTTVRSVHRSKGLILFSIMGAVCAILWVLIIGSAIRVLGRYIYL